MKKIGFIIALLFFIVSFFLNILGLMKLVPIYITSPLLFFSILIIIYILNYRKTFKGF